MVPAARRENVESSNVPNLLFELVKHAKEDEKEGIFTDPLNNADKNSWMQILCRKCSKMHIHRRERTMIWLAQCHEDATKYDPASAHLRSGPATLSSTLSHRITTPFTADEDPTSKIHVKINPLSNGGGPISASVDELRTLASGLTLSPANTGSVSHLSVLVSRHRGCRV